ncbi:peptidase S8/S53 domain-containing protein [Lactarius quietus]|nr:peptidase S8/S53 domain-containing protein [Lactarius quietus]
MRCCQLAILCVLTAAPLHNLAKPLAPHWDHIRVKHSWNNVPPHWESLGHPPAGTTIDLNIVLMPYNENALIDALYDVSDPTSPKYGSHLSKEQVNRLIAPHQNTLDLVHSWLGYHDIPSSSISMTRGGSWLTLKGVPISQANKLLGASYQLYRHAGTNDTAIPRTIGYSLPTALHAHVQTVMPTTYLSTRTPWQTPQKHSTNSTVNMESRGLLRMLSIRDIMDSAVTPSSLRSLYRMTAYVPAATDKNVLAIVGFRNQYPSPADFELFMATCRSDVANPLAAFTHVEVNGGTFDLGRPGPGANANMQYTEGLAYPTPIRFYSVGGEITVIDDTNEPARDDMILEWLLLVLDQETVPQTITISYGVFEKFIPQEYAVAICNMFAELGSRGASVLVASGNDGVGPPAAEECLDRSGSLRFPIEFPTSCPWVTSVGGTSSPVFRAEIGARFSGGGFSSYFPRPLTRKLPWGRQYNDYYHREARGIPDISAQAVNYYTIYEGLPVLSSSTTCAAATVASIISLLNDYRISTRRKPLGFLNLWLYGHGREGLYDVIYGYNPGCGTRGFFAIHGWDPVTGLGTPDFLLLQYTLDYIPVGTVTTTTGSSFPTPGLGGSTADPTPH